MGKKEEPMTAEQAEELRRLASQRLAVEEKWVIICRRFHITKEADLFNLSTQAAERFISGLRKLPFEGN